jgi:hypothetical protein
MIDLKEQKLLDEDYVSDFNDLLKIQKALFMYRDMFVSIDEAAIIWQDYSSASAANWLCIPEKLEDIPKQIESQDGFKGYAI